MSIEGAAPASTVPARSCRGDLGDAFPSMPMRGMLHAGLATVTAPRAPVGRIAPRARANACDAPWLASDGSVVAVVLLSFAAMATAKLTKKEIDEFEARLQVERTELAEQLATIEDQTFATTQSDLSGDVGVDDESADAGTATFEREKELSIEQNVRDLLQKIDRALKRIEAGTYGICERCGKPIEKARIKALPYVDLCIKDAQAQSRR